ncbi:unnamed protein product [Prorocentrum cordatum]|uniref:Uncharacterized protein n=1 Tax=Prorocentrum cordatum TaxID=2364126 RepID=A0ABN9UP66_9DINO|nr:unnamed protein product [Polarella glacialis]
MADGSSGKKFLNVSKAMWDIVDKFFDPAKVLTQRGYELIQTYSIRAAHPVLPYVMHFLAMMCALSNGAKSAWFPHAHSPMFLMVLNVNFAQTRKSSITGNGDSFGDKLDQVARDVVAQKVLAAASVVGDMQGAPPRDERGRRRRNPDAADPSGAADPPRQPQVAPCVLHAATPTEFFHRCAGDYQQVPDAENFPGVDVRGRHVHGVLVNPDEAYDTLTSFNFMGEQKAGKKQTTVNAFQSAFNKLAQYGKASRATKTAGSYGRVDAPTVSVGISGNIHFSTYVPMERGETGSHHTAAKERILISTGRPVQPHAPLPDTYAMPAGTLRHKWVPLVAEVAEALELVAGSAPPDQAARVWARAARPREDDAASSETVDGKVYVPDAEGFSVTLPDGVQTQVRFQRDASAPTGFRPEWLVADRSFPMPAHHSLETCVPRVTTYFEKPHVVLEPTVEALALHQSIAGREYAGAALGAAPRHLGELASALCIFKWLTQPGVGGFDIFCGRYDDTEEHTSRKIAPQEEHVERAASPLKVVHLLKVAAASTEEEPEPAAAYADTAEQRRVELAAFLASSQGAFDGLWSASQHARADRPPVDAPPAASEASAHGGVSRGGAAHEGAPGGGPTSGPGILVLEDVKGLDFGYGADGSSVQDGPFHAAGLTDRNIMRRTLLVGTPTATMRAACERMKSSRRGGQRPKHLPEQTWLRVMEAGLQGSPVARLDGREIHVARIPGGQADRVAYHNALMRLCALPLRDLVEAMKKAKENSDRRERGACPAGAFCRLMNVAAVKRARYLGAKHESKCQTIQAILEGRLSEITAEQVLDAIRGLEATARQCPACDKRMVKRPGSGSDAIVLDVGGPVCKTHVPYRCNSVDCPKRGLVHWHNYYVDAGRHIFHGDVAAMKCIMLTASFGITTEYLEALHERMLREHVSFAGEADVARARAGGTALPANFRKYLSKGWFVWRLARRVGDLGPDDTAVIDLMQPLEDQIKDTWDQLELTFERRTAERARAAGMKTDVVAVDGNAKNRRLTRAAPLRHCATCPRLARRARAGCPRTPLLGSAFCGVHGVPCECPAEDYEVVGHEAPEAGGMGLDGSLKLLVRERRGELRELWVSESAVDLGIVNVYFHGLGEDRRAASAGRRGAKARWRRAAASEVRRQLDAAAPAWDALTPVEREQLLSEMSCEADLKAVACNTHKEDDSQQAKCARTAGVLCARLSSGIVVYMREMFGCESLSQRFTERRASDSPQAARLAPPAISYICDAFHMSGHTDAWCKANCNPAAPHLKTLVEGVRTSVCEFTFTWMSQYKHQTKHMSEWGFKFFLQEMCMAHNEALFKGSALHLTHTSGD